MENNLEDFLEEEMTKQVDDVLGTNSEDAEAEEEYENEYQDELAEEMNDESYYGRDAGEVLEELEQNLDGEEIDEEEENEDNEENYISNNTNAIGRIGEKFAKKYLEELFKLNDVDLKVKPHNNNGEDYDIEVFGNEEEYLIEVKLSKKETGPDFAEIHFDNNFKYLLLIWLSNNKFYFSILSKEEIIKNKYATEMHYGREEDNYVIQTQKIFSKDFLKELAIKLNIEKDLMDLSDERKLEIYDDAENEAENEFEKLYEDIDKNSLYYKLGLIGNTERGKIAQHSLYKFLKQYDANAENYDRGDFDILYKNKKLEVKFSRLGTDGTFQFAQIKSKDFEFLFLIEIDKSDNFYFDLMTKEVVEKKIDEAYSQNGNRIHLSKNSSRIQFVNHLTIEEIDNYIEKH